MAGVSSFGAFILHVWLYLMLTRRLGIIVCVCVYRNVGPSCSWCGRDFKPRFGPFVIFLQVEESVLSMIQISAFVEYGAVQKYLRAQYIYLTVLMTTFH